LFEIFLFVEAAVVFFFFAGVVAIYVGYLSRSSFVGYKIFAKASCLIEVLLLRVGARRDMLVIMLFREPTRGSVYSSDVLPENLSITQHAL
jgi:hypothetical protein